MNEQKKFSEKLNFFICVPGMAIIQVVKVHCGGTHRPTTKEAQGTCREMRAGGSVE